MPIPNRSPGSFDFQRGAYHHGAPLLTQLLPGLFPCIRRQLCQLPEVPFPDDGRHPHDQDPRGFRSHCSKGVHAANWTEGKGSGSGSNHLPTDLEQQLPRTTVTLPQADTNGNRDATLSYPYS